MAGGRKTFACGHRGRGQFCHRCAAEQQARVTRAETRLAWQQQLGAAPIALGHLPLMVAEAALACLADLDSGEPARVLERKRRGKRLVSLGQHEVWTFALPQFYRLICREDAAGLQPIEAISHERYNNRLSQGGWPRCPGGQTPPTRCDLPVGRPALPSSEMRL